MKASDFKVGDTLYYVPHRNRGGGNPIVHVVRNVARKWVTAGPDGGPNHLCERFDPETMYADGGGYSSPGRYYMSEAHFITEQQADSAWENLFCHRNRYQRPKHVGAEQIEQAMELLGLK